MYILVISTPFSENSVLKECYKISPGKDIAFEVSVNSKGIAIHNYVHPVNLHFHQFNLIKLQSAVLLPSNDIDHSSITSPGGVESEKLKKVVEVWCRGRSS